MALRKTAWISRIPLVLGLAFGVAFHAAPASAAVTLNFDTFGSLGCDATNPATSGVPGGYGGLNWSSVSGGFGTDVVGLECDANYAGSFGNTYGAPSSDFAAYNSQGFGEVLITPVSGTFDFFGAQFSSFVSFDGVLGYDPYSAYSVQVVGYQGGVPTLFATLDLYSDNGVTINPATYFPLSVSWTGLDGLAFFAGDNIIANSPTFGNDGRSFLFDDVTITIAEETTVPEPGTTLLLLAGLGLVAMARLPKRRRLSAVDN